jgi:hypothetical protein
VRLTYAPGPPLRGRVALVSPALDPGTRTAKVRIELDNPGGALRPDAFADVLIATDAGDRTVVPKQAVVQSGERSIVFVDRGGGRLAPREIQTGLRFDDDLEGPRGALARREDRDVGRVRRRLRVPAACVRRSRTFRAGGGSCARDGSGSAFAGFGRTREHRRSGSAALIGWIIERCAQYRFLVLGVYAALGVVAVLSLRSIPLDAIPDLSDTQVIVYSRWDRSPDILEDQVTYPITTALLGAPRVKAIRGFSDFGFSYVYVIFQDGTDLYWARSRVLEYLSKIQPRLPEGVSTELGPDATGVGWVFQYAIVDPSGQHSLADLRSYQDWNLRYHLQAVPGVAEVASLGGFVKEYQVNVDPRRLVSYGIPLDRVVAALRGSNEDVGGRLVEISGTEYMVRGRGYVRSLDDLERIVVKSDPGAAPVLLRDVATLAIGPAMRRGVGDVDGRGDTVGGIVVMRQGGNALEVIAGVKARLRELEPSLPAGVRIVPTYDRSELILRSIETLRHELIVEMIVVSLVILVFLWHIPSAIVPIVTIPPRCSSRSCR